MSQYSSSSLRWSGSARDLIAGSLRGHAAATHSVEALDVADVLVDEEVQFAWHVGHAAAAWARDERHVCVPVGGEELEQDGRQAKIPR